MADSETAFRVWKIFNYLYLFCEYCLFSCLFFRSDAFCLCGVITRSFLSFLFKQLWNTIVCLFPRLSLDISVKVMVAISRG